MDFDTFCLWNYPGGGRARYWNPDIVRDGSLLETTEKDYGPDIFTDFLIEFIAKNKSRPFFAYYPMALVHSPFPPTPDSEPTDANINDKQNFSSFYPRRLSAEVLNDAINSVAVSTTRSPPTPRSVPSAGR